MFKNMFENVKKAVDHATDNVTPENFSYNEVKEYERRKKEIESEMLTDTQKEILGSVPTREELEVMKQQHREKRSENGNYFKDAA